MTAKPNPRLARQTKHKPQYDYRCEDCGSIVTRDFREATFIAQCASMQCDDATRMFKRTYTSAPAYRQGDIDAHFNQALGKPISSMRQFRSELSRASDDASAHTGIDHKYAPVEYGDKQAAGIDSDHLADTTRKVGTTRTFV